MLRLSVLLMLLVLLVMVASQTSSILQNTKDHVDYDHICKIMCHWRWSHVPSCGCASLTQWVKRSVRHAAHKPLLRHRRSLLQALMSWK